VLHFFAIPVCMQRQIRRLLFVAAATLAAPVYASNATDGSDSLCMTRYNDQIRLTTPTGIAVPVVSPIVLTCRGHIDAGLAVHRGRNTQAQLQLQHQQDGEWLTVAQGRQITHAVHAGTWRLVLLHSGAQGATFDGSLRYSIPRP